MTLPNDEETQSLTVKLPSAPATSGPVPKPIELAVGTTPQVLPNMPAAGASRYLVGFMDRPMFVQHLQSTGIPIDAVREQVLLREFEAAVDVRGRLAPIDLAPGDVKQINGPAQEAWIRGVVAEPVFQSVFGSQQVVFAHLPIAKLTGFQAVVKAMHVAVPTDDDEILQWCLPKQFLTQYQLQILPGLGGMPRVVITTDDPTALFAVNADGDGARIAMQARPNWVQVVATENRLIVRNGYHRVAALAAQGRTTVPAILSLGARIDDIIPPGPGWFSASYLRGLQRPPLVTDFLNSSITMELPEAKMKRVFEVRLAVSEIPVPV